MDSGEARRWGAEPTTRVGDAGFSGTLSHLNGRGKYELQQWAHKMWSLGLMAPLAPRRLRERQGNCPRYHSSWVLKSGILPLNSSFLLGLSQA